MKERPILFSAPMVRAILSGNKTHTRRIVKPQPHPTNQIWGEVEESDNYPGEWFQWLYGGEKTESFTCPYGQLGDRLWVRETWSIVDHDFGMQDGKEFPCAWLISYAANRSEEWRNPPNRLQAAQRYGTANGDFAGDGKGPKFRPSIFMPRWASRLTLEITDIRVERLNDISEEDCESEGIFSHIAEGSRDKVYRDKRGETAKKYFRELWDSINSKKHPFVSNPFVWVVVFDRILSASEPL